MRVSKQKGIFLHLRHERTISNEDRDETNYAIKSYPDITIKLMLLIQGVFLTAWLSFDTVPFQNCNRRVDTLNFVTKI